EEQVAKLSELENIISEQTQKETEFVQGFTRRANDLSGLTEEIEVAQGVEKKISADIEMLNVEMAGGKRVTVHTDPYVTKRESAAIKTAGVAGGAGFLAVVAAISLLEFLARRVNSVSEVARGLRLPVVGTLPLVRSRGGVLSKGPGAAEST